LTHRAVIKEQALSGLPNRRKTMSATSDKIKGLANQAEGKIKQSVGEAVGNPKLQAKGNLQKRVGEAQQAIGETKTIIKDAIDKA
jgi:uncharacterized protein YjbJ (UPF0337 family)